MVESLFSHVVLPPPLSQFTAGLLLLDSAPDFGFRRSCNAPPGTEYWEKVEVDESLKQEEEKKTLHECIVQCVGTKLSI
jgi:hypothetical protein